ncbi:ABC transporter ATP-binding protein [Allobranchiibius sp. GilTou73]|uniref:ABC transporter ATP-binding protein n=1 Tax=Allobranchiibius sp. GilTou73 TaxID=2904523 RepID=UPI001F240060|nr:ABC transporter ATP-binding protein [Allobranchiibius sp. GilTou73]UIJ33769.1 ABC transporter ATP-binding protein [Allobranchiibius sp. GilTou73]
MSIISGVNEALRVEDVTKQYGSRRNILRALDGVSLELQRGEILGLVGESGSGKSTLAKIIAGGTRQTSGRVLSDGSEIGIRRDAGEHRRIQMVFQDPYSSLNPRLTVRSTLAEVLRVHKIVPRDQIDKEVSRLMGLVGLDDSALDAYPGQFSGGQRQRIAIARALAVRPEVLVADEPVSALDVSVQATILDLFRSLRTELGLSVLFIAHNLAVVQHLVDRIAVMYLGRIVEVAPVQALFAAPQHPYTKALIASVPRMRSVDLERAPAIEGEPPSPIHLPEGCRFNPRCAHAQSSCLDTDPALQPAGAPDHLAACLFAGALQPRSIAATKESA